jgi:Putative MetA-pathway of phenol degradation
MRYLAVLVLLSSSTAAGAQDLVPGAYTPAPVGFTILNVTGVFSDGAISFDPSLPIDDARSTVGGVGIGIGRTLNIAGRFANIGVGIPLVAGHVEGLVLDQFQETSRVGQGDVSMRFAVNLFGAPAMTLKEFAAYRAKTVVGVSLTVGTPVGQYDSTKYINLGANRWSFRPEVGIALTQGPWTFEGDVALLFFTDNANYVNSSTRAQAPIVGLQGHLIRTFRPGFWVAADGNYWKGGRVTMNGTPQMLEQENSRIGATFAYPIRRHQLRFSYSFGAYTTIGGDFQSVGMSYTYAWAAYRSN